MKILHIKKSMLMFLRSFFCNFSYLCEVHTEIFIDEICHLEFASKQSREWRNGWEHK